MIGAKSASVNVLTNMMSGEAHTRGGAHKYIHHRGECTQVRVHSCTPGEKAHQEWEAQQDREAHVECTKNGRQTRLL